MKIFKFGGASVKDAEGVKNVATVITKCDEKDLVIVISAMGKMTNALEKVVDSYFKSPDALELAINEVLQFHINISIDIFKNKQHLIFSDIKEILDGLRGFLKTNKSTNHAFVYDQVVGYGEMLSTLIVSTFLNEQHISNTLLDVRECIVTDDSFRDANVDWQASQIKILTAVSKTGITITQGFLGTEAKNNFTTTLGREGSDYTAAIFAYCLNADSVTIWKDVPGVLNADPRYFSTTTLLNHISYREAIELAFYGASVIHPKTLQPLQRKEIPLFVKSFYEPENAGTCVGKGTTLDPAVSCFILKRNQVLISLSSLDFSFMMEDRIGDVFKWLHFYKMKVELIQNSAISFSVVVDNKYANLEPLLSKLRSKFKVSWNENVTLYTVRHSEPKEIKQLEKNKIVLLKQESRETVQLVIKD
ncbi:aspartate kinase [Patiriisocius marinus]|uniref:Aspartokinase n=1 Tax=Patiriisocius marinus TaxID=1397112 RepID=A0A5J4IXW5_9FLAO|nr:aspartate kinase [Patiriisocius marinus]GER58448.1 aspartokinase [Patiriisocius marinus]